MPSMQILSPLEQRTFETPPQLNAAQRKSAFDLPMGFQKAVSGLAVRQECSLPLLADLKAYLEASLTRISRKSDLAKAINYSLNRWEALCRFANDGRLEIINNAAERAIRPANVGRRNWPFLGCRLRRRASI